MLANDALLQSELLPWFELDYDNQIIMDVPVQTGTSYKYAQATSPVNGMVVAQATYTNTINSFNYWQNFSIDGVALCTCGCIQGLNAQNGYVEKDHVVELSFHSGNTCSSTVRFIFIPFKVD